MVTSYLQLLNGATAAAGARERVRRFAVDGAKRMRALIRGLLQFSRVRTQEVSFHHIELDACAADALANLEVPAASPARRSSSVSSAPFSVIASS